MLSCDEKFEMCQVIALYADMLQHAVLVSFLAAQVQSRDLHHAFSGSIIAAPTIDDRFGVLAFSCGFQSERHAVHSILLMTYFKNS